MGHSYNNRKGIALVVTLVMLTILLVLGMAFMTISSRDYVYARYVVMRNQAAYLCESGIEYAQLKRINWIQYPHTESFDFEGGTIKIEVTEPSTGTAEIKSTGTCGSFSRTVRVRYGSDGTIQSWEEL
ncbi:MAG: pilus assembly PilX N-terminal domain-containing protein [Firmicutes bacterium]|nr:pilus assembly PilX N-terminal domain-containing protein [Bacillota bacterium]